MARRRRRGRAGRPDRDEYPREPIDDGLPDGWMEWGGEILFVVGFTSGGAPYGLHLDEFPPEDLPEELRELAASRAASDGASAGQHGRADTDVPF